jgi:type IV secretory pathway TrbD component
MVSKFWGEVIQLSGLICLVIGIGIEVYYKADFGYTILTIGSFVYAVGTKFKHRGGK